MEAAGKILAEIADITSQQNIDLLNNQLNELVTKANRWLNFSIACAWTGFLLIVLVIAYMLYNRYNDKKHKHVKGER